MEQDFGACFTIGIHGFEGNPEAEALNPKS